METKILVTGSTFFSQVKADLCNNLHSLIIFFFFSKGRFFGGGLVSKKGGRADAGQIPTVGLCSVKRMFRCSTSDDLTNDTSYMAALSEADALITFLVGHSLHRSHDDFHHHRKRRQVKCVHK